MERKLPTLNSMLEGDMDVEKRQLTVVALAGNGQFMSSYILQQVSERRRLNLVEFS